MSTLTVQISTLRVTCFWMKKILLHAILERQSLHNMYFKQMGAVIYVAAAVLSNKDIKIKGIRDGEEEPLSWYFCTIQL